VRVEHVDRQDPVGQDAARIKELQEKAAGEQRSDLRRQFERRAALARAEASRRAGYVVYGWSVHADAAGKALDQEHAMSGFLVPYSDEHARVMAGAKEGSFMTVAREGSEEVFTCGGRRFFRAARAGRARADSQDWPDPPGAARLFPSRLAPQKSAAVLEQLLETSLSFVRTEEREKGGGLVRYMVNIEAKGPRAAPAPPGEGDKGGGPPLHVWLHVRIAVADGVIIGPIIEHVEVPRGDAGGYRISRSLEFITSEQAAKLDAKSASVEPIAME
jgi:hypothetical protein